LHTKIGEELASPGNASVVSRTSPSAIRVRDGDRSQHCYQARHYAYGESADESQSIIGEDASL